MATTSRYVPYRWDAEQRRTVVEGLARLTETLDSTELARLIAADHSLYHDYLEALERYHLRRLLGQNRDLADRLTVEDLIELLREARPDLYTTVCLDGGRRWLQRQWQELRDIIHA